MLHLYVVAGEQQADIAV